MRQLLDVVGVAGTIAIVFVAAMWEQISEYETQAWTHKKQVFLFIISSHVLGEK